MREYAHHFKDWRGNMYHALEAQAAGVSSFVSSGLLVSGAHCGVLEEGKQSKVLKRLQLQSIFSVKKVIP